MTSSINHTIFLALPSRRRETIHVNETMTLQELGQEAKKQLQQGNNSNAAEIVLTTGFPAQTVDWKGSTKLVRNFIPHRSLVQCTTANKTNEEETVKYSDVKTDSVAKTDQDEPPTKKVKTEPEVIDLLDDSDDDEIKSKSDEAKENQSHPTDKTLDDPRVPSQVTEAGEYWIYQQGPAPYQQESVLGKWLVFRNEPSIDAVWKAIALAVKSGQLKAAAAKVATRYNHQTNVHARPKGGNSSSYVICVYTSEQRLEEVGRTLIQMPQIQHDLRYKTDAMTMAGNYASTSSQKVSHTTLYWNRGLPSFTKIKIKLMTAQQSLRLLSQQQDHVKLSFSFDSVRVTVKGLKHSYYKKKCNPPLQQRMAVTLIREPHNRYDSNAIRVDLCRTDCSTTSNSNDVLGHVGKEQAAVLASWMDRHLIQVNRAVVDRVLGDHAVMIELQGKACPAAEAVLEEFL